MILLMLPCESSSKVLAVDNNYSHTKASKLLQVSSEQRSRTKRSKRYQNATTQSLGVSQNFIKATQLGCDIISSDRSSCNDDGLLYIRQRQWQQLFQIFTQSLDAIDVTSVTLSRLNSINAIDVTKKNTKKQGNFDKYDHLYDVLRKYGQRSIFLGIN